MNGFRLVIYGGSPPWGGGEYVRVHVGEHLGVGLGTGEWVLFVVPILHEGE